MSEQLKKLQNETKAIKNRKSLDSIVKERDLVKHKLLVYETGISGITSEENRKDWEEHEKLNNEILIIVNESCRNLI